MGECEYVRMVWIFFSESDYCYSVVSETSNIVSEVSKPSARAGWEGPAEGRATSASYNKTITTIGFKESHWLCFYWGCKENMKFVNLFGIHLTDRKRITDIPHTK